MKHLFYIIVIGFCAALLALQHFPAMAASQGIKESGPWLLAMVFDFVFGVATFIKLVGPEKLQAVTNDEDGFELADIVIPDVMFYKIVIVGAGVVTLMNGYSATMAGIGGSIYWGLWILVDVLVVAFAILLLRHVQAVIARKARNERNAPRPISNPRGRDVA